MSNRFRITVAVVLVALIGLPTLALTFADPPEKRQHLELPDLPDLKLPLRKSNSPGTQKRIREALDGGGPTETGDAVLDDVLQIIQRRGSLFEGSELEQLESELGVSNKPSKSVSQNARAAEAMLKAARFLEKLPSPDKSRRELVNLMRRETVRLLTQ